MNVWLRALVYLGVSYGIGGFVTHDWGLGKDEDAAAHGDGAHVDAHGHGHDGVPGPWTTLAFWAQLGTFAVLLDLAVSKLGPGISGSLVTRKEELTKNLEEAREFRAKAEAAYNEYTARLAKLDQEIQALKNEMVRAGEAERDRIVAEAEGKAMRMRRDAQFIIEQQVKQLRIDVKREAATRAVVAAEAALREQLTEADQKRLAEDFLRRLSTAGDSLQKNAGASQPSGAVQ